MGGVLAQGQRFTQQEILALPRVCLAQKFVNSWLHHPVVPEDERKLWADKLGEKDYVNFHHYCGGLIDMRRAAEADEESERASSYKRAVSNFDYVQRKVSPEFPLLPEVYVRKGLAFRLLGDDMAAGAEFNDAIRLKQDYTPAYAALADLLVDSGDINSARDLLKRGLRVVPESKILTKKLAEVEAAGTDPP
jgi:tetratricopeptide (TPR) repeat protein